MDDAARGALVEVVAGACGLAEQEGDFFGLGFELEAVGFGRAGLVAGFDHLVG